MINLSIDPKAPAADPNKRVVSGAFVVADNERRVFQTRNLTEAVVTALGLAAQFNANIRVYPNAVAGLTLPRAGVMEDDALTLSPADFKALYLPAQADDDLDGNGVADDIEESLRLVGNRIKKRGSVNANDLAEMSAAGIPVYAYVRKHGEYTDAELREFKSQPADDVLPLILLGYVDQFGATETANTFLPYLNKVSEAAPDDSLTEPPPPDLVAAVPVAPVADQSPVAFVDETHDGGTVAPPATIDGTPNDKHDPPPTDPPTVAPGNADDAGKSKPRTSKGA